MPHRWIVLVSGDGIGAGKTTFAHRLKGTQLSLAGALRDELQATYPAYDWHRRDQEYKDNTLVPEWGPGATVRQAMLEYGQQQCKDRPWYWARRTANLILAGREGIYIIDDVRKGIELKEFRLAFANVVHYHVHNWEARHEPAFDNAELAALADYVVSWRPTERPAGRLDSP
jgi:hypothetical protein